jgi:hypothetical protein
MIEKARGALEGIQEVFPALDFTRGGQVFGG